MPGMPITDRQLDPAQTTWRDGRGRIARMELTGGQWGNSSAVWIDHVTGRNRTQPQADDIVLVSGNASPVIMPMKTHSRSR